MGCGCKKKVQQVPPVQNNVVITETKETTQTTQGDVQLTEQQQAQVDRIIEKIKELES
jgi:hypothetical protein